MRFRESASESEPGTLLKVWLQPEIWTRRVEDCPGSVHSHGLLTRSVSLADVCAHAEGSKATLACDGIQLIIEGRDPRIT